LAFFTFFLAFGGNLARLGTILVETDDFLYLLQSLTGVFLNGVLIFQFMLYWNSGTKVDASKTPSKKGPAKKGDRKKLD